MSLQHVYDTFYRIPRLSATETSDGGGPFGFDIHTAIAFDFLIERYGCDAIIETGCNQGDTTHYLAQCYPELKILTCDVVAKYTDFVRDRVSKFSNTTVEERDSVDLLKRVQGRFVRPLFYLDAHWYDEWPLERELATITQGVVMIDDFDIGDRRYDYDEYKGVACGPGILRPYAKKFSHFYVNNPNADFEVPCLQVGRRGGRAFALVGMDVDHMRASPMFSRRETDPQITAETVLSVIQGVVVSASVAYDDKGAPEKSLTITLPRGGSAFAATSSTRPVLDAIDGRRTVAAIIRHARDAGATRFSDSAALDFLKALHVAGVVRIGAGQPTG